MNKKIKPLCKGVFFSAVLALSLLATGADATVGGPTFIHTFKYNPADESVYYILNSYSGRGCPPELVKLSLATSKTQVVYSCNEGEKLMANGGYDFSPVNIEINKIISNFKNLIPINLKSNRISVDVSFVNYENFSPEVDEIMNANFTAIIYQNGKQVTDFPISGCNIEQPFTFAGYAIPGFEKKIVLLLSTKGDCWEGGYIGESLYVVGGVDNLDKTYSSNFHKENSALVPNEDTLVVFESDKITTGNTNPTNSDIKTTNENPPNNLDENQKRDNVAGIMTVVALVSLLMGIVLGRFLLKK